MVFFTLHGRVKTAIPVGSPNYSEIKAALSAGAFEFADETPGGNGPSLLVSYEGPDSLIRAVDNAFIAAGLGGLG